MNLLEFAAINPEVGKIVSYGFLGLMGILLVTFLVIFIVSVVAQRKYETDALPSLEELNPDDELSDEELEDEEESVFLFEEDNEADSNVPAGDSAAEELLKDMRAVESAPSRTSSFNPFSKKKS